MTSRKKPEIDWAAAREAWESGASNTEAARAGGTNRETVRRRAIDDGWQRNDEQAEQAAEERRRQGEAARIEADRRWSNRRSREADAAGITAARARQAIIEAITDKDEKMIRATAVAYGILIDKAQLLSGAATVMSTAEAEQREALADGYAKQLAAAMRAFAEEANLDPSAPEVRKAMRESLTVIHGTG